MPRIAAIAALVAGLLATGWQAPVQAAEPTPACPPSLQAAAFPAADTEAAAARLAEACGFPVEALDGASARTQVMAMPDGSSRLRATATETRALKDGSWQRIDTALRTGPDGLLRPAVSGADVVFSPGGDGPFAVMRGAGAEFSLAWPHSLPRGVVDGESVTYPEVQPGVDLVVRATSTGFSHVLVVKTPEAAADPRVRATEYVIGGSAEVTTSDDGVVISGPDGMLASAPPAVAWDSVVDPAPRSFSAGEPDVSTHAGPGADAVTAPVDVRSDGRVLTVRSDAELFETATYPLFIDPVYGNRVKWIPVNDSRPGQSWTSGDGWPREIVRVGDDYDNRGDLWRAHFEFDTRELRGTRIIKTPSVVATATHSGWCGGETVGLWQTNAVSNNTPTWDGMKGTWLHGGALDTATVKANEGCTGEKNHDITFTSGVGEQVKRHVAENYNSITFGLRMASESGGHWTKFSPDSVALNVEYEHKPTNARTVGDPGGSPCVQTQPGPWINSSSPRLLGKATDKDGQVKLQFNVNVADGSGVPEPAVYTSAWTTSDAERGWTVPKLADAGYSWQVRGIDEGGAADATPWSAYCWFRIDSARPAIPVIERTSAGSPTTGQPVTLKLTSSDARSGLRGFHYGVGTEAKEQFAASTGATEITVTPQEGRTVIHVWAQDNAQNYSTRVTYDILTGKPIAATAVAAWRFDGDHFDDAGNGHTFTPESGVMLQGDRNGNPESALALDSSGTGCAPVDSDGPAVRTDAGFTVAGWARLSNTTAYHAIVTQSGVHTPAFYLQYAPKGTSVDRWRFSLGISDSTTPEYVSVTSDRPSVAGVWEHVAVTVDPIAGVMRMFINGAPVNTQTFDVKPFLGTGELILGCGKVGTEMVSRMRGLIDHVGIWQGVLTDAEIARSMTELPSAMTGGWDLRGSGADTSPYQRDLAIPEVPGDTNYTDDPFGRSKSAIAFDGTWCASATGPVVRTHESFSVAAWAKAGATGRPMTVVSQAGQNRAAFALVRTADGKWSFTKTAADSVDAVEVAATTPTADAGGWRHLVGVFDAPTRELRLYVDGVLQSTAAAPSTTWNAAAPLQIGCTDTLGAAPGQLLSGAVTDLRTWRGGLTAAEVAAVHGQRESVDLQALWWLNGPDSSFPTGLDDYSGAGNHLEITGPYGWTYDRWDVVTAALTLDLAAGSCARTSGPVTATDSSFTVAAWVNLPDVSGDHTVVAQAGGSQAGYTLGLVDGKWTFAMASADSASATWSSAVSTVAPAPDTWTYVAGVFDLGKGLVQLYVDGELQAEVAAPSAPWNATGPTYVGCETLGAEGLPENALAGAVDDVLIWSGPVDADRLHEDGIFTPGSV